MQFQRELGRITTFVLFVLIAASPTLASAGKAVDAVDGELSIMVLGSGGPLPPAGRASTGYLLFTDGQPRYLMDAGGGTYARFAESGANIKDLDGILMTHAHIDHMADVPAMIKGLYFQNRGAGAFRTKPIEIYGPDANGVTFPGSSHTQYPSTSEFTDDLFGKASGADRYLNIFGQAINGGKFQYQAHDISPDTDKPVRTVIDDDGLVVKAVGVVHGPVPALAYRVEYKGHSIVFSGDTSTKTANMAELTDGADLLIYDTAVMEDLPKRKVFFKLHSKPSQIGQVAAKARPGNLVLSHITPVTAPRLDEVKAIIRDQGYEGNLRVAEDLDVYNLGD